LVKLFLRSGFDRKEVADAGIDEEDVHLAIQGLYFGYKGISMLKLAVSARKPVALPPSSLTASSMAACFTSCDDDLCSLCYEFLGGCQSDTTVAAGNDGDFVAKLLIFPIFYPLFRNDFY